MVVVIRESPIELLSSCLRRVKFWGMVKDLQKFLWRWRMWLMETIGGRVRGWKIIT
jgi:hypothetical protein